MEMKKEEEAVKVEGRERKRRGKGRSSMFFLSVHGGQGLSKGRRGLRRGGWLEAWNKG